MPKYTNMRFCSRKTEDIKFKVLQYTLGQSQRIGFPAHSVSYQISNMGSSSGQKQPYSELINYPKTVEN